MVLKIKILDAFDYFPGNHGLTEEVIYSWQPTNEEESNPIFSGSKDNILPIGYIQKNAKNNKEEDISSFNGECLILTKDGSAGLFTYKNEGNFTVNHHACILKIKCGWENKINLEWFAYQYQKRLYQYVTSKSDNGVFSTKWFDKILFEVPDDYNLQLRQKDKKRKLNYIFECIKNQHQHLKKLVINSKTELKTGEFYSMKQIFHFKGGNSGLTGDFIYNNQPNIENESIPIFSGATLKTNSMGCISKSALLKNKKMKIFNGSSILVARKGYNAGTITYIDNGEFTINDDAYVLVPKKEWKNKINLRWFLYQYQDLFYNIVSSKSDNATFNKTYAKKEKVIIPDKDFQDRIAEKLLKIEHLIEELERTNEHIEELLFCEIIN